MKQLTPKFQPQPDRKPLDQAYASLVLTSLSKPSNQTPIEATSSSEVDWTTGIFNSMYAW